MAAMAEQESRTISTNIKWAWQRKFQNGEIILNTGLMLGYEKAGKDEEGMTIYKIKEDEAEIVRRIYREFLSGITVTRICRRLEADGILTPLGKEKWCPSTIKSILTNEKYTGNAVLGKTFKPDVLTKRRQKNDGEKSPMYYAEDTHPAIIDQGTFNMVKAEMKRRKDLPAEAIGNSRFTSKYPFSGLLVCGICGTGLRRHVRTVGSGKRVASWGCSNLITNGRTACDSHHVREDVLERTYAEAIKKMADNADAIIETVQDGAMKAMQPQSTARLQEVEQEITRIQETVITIRKNKQNNLITQEQYIKEISIYSEKMKTLEKEQEELQTAEMRYKEVKRWLDDFKEALDKGNNETTTDITLIRALVECITVNDDGIEVKFKCGARVKQEYIK